MIVYPYHIIGESFCYKRIIDAFKKFSPEKITFTDNYSEADTDILHVNGRRDQFYRIAEKSIKEGRKYIVAQYCLRSTQRKSTQEWKWLWENALLVWSYYDLNKMIREDGGNWQLNNFLHSPLGADENVFTMAETEKKFIAMTSGGLASIDNESTREVASAANILNKNVFHLGPNINLGANVTYGHNINDNEIVSAYRASEYVCGLRRIEGFELPAVEGLFCGARPILFDRDHYRKWYEPWAEFIPESHPIKVNRKLIELFKCGARPVSQQERNEAVSIFGWNNVINNFWNKII